MSWLLALRKSQIPFNAEPVETKWVFPGMWPAGGGTASWCIAELHRLPVNALRLVGFNRVVP
jgi:hypothetical protein